MKSSANVVFSEFKSSSNYKQNCLVFIVFVKGQHEIGQLLGLRQRYSVVEGGTNAAYRAMTLQLDHALRLGLGQELLFQRIISRGTGQRCLLGI